MNSQFRLFYTKVVTTLSHSFDYCPKSNFIKKIQFFFGGGEKGVVILLLRNNIKMIMTLSVDYIVIVESLVVEVIFL